MDWTIKTKQNMGDVSSIVSMSSLLFLTHNDFHFSSVIFLDLNINL